MEYLSRINTSLRTLEILCNRYQVRRMAFFGSVLRDDFNEYSDVDVLVEFLSGAEIDYIDFHTFRIGVGPQKHLDIIDKTFKKCVKKGLRRVFGGPKRVV